MQNKVLGKMVRFKHHLHKNLPMWQQWEENFVLAQQGVILNPTTSGIQAVSYFLVKSGFWTDGP